MKAKSIMIQGTMSNAGKSLVTAGLCRIFMQDGHSVVPFKSQNMALNSFITKDGFEMGRAQVMQAEAAGVEPSVLMNPILLKPTNDTGSQVIVGGEVVGNMSAADYFKYKSKLVPDVIRAYDELSQNHDIIVIEGAGSPAEINLKAEDIVNMGLAKMVDAPVLLVGDIDRGGVFASLYGTVCLLEEDERARIKGLIINKFRGDPEILRPGLKMLEDLTGIPVIGVIPFLNVDIDDEDSLSDRFNNSQVKKPIDIAVIKLPRISNFTDFNALERHPQLGVRYIRSAAEFGSPDLVILPGTKNTMGDLAWLRQSGLEALIKKHAANELPIIGICGGYQMLGQKLSDPHDVEQGGEMSGIGLLQISTVFEKEKTRTQVSGRVTCDLGFFSSICDARIEGYEIHMGSSELLNGAISATQITTQNDVHSDGAVEKNVLGSYVHGFFDCIELVNKLAHALLEKKGIDSTIIEEISAQEYKDKQYNILANGVRSSIDMKRIYEIMG